MLIALPLVGQLTGRIQARYLMAFGWAILAIAMLVSTRRIDLQISFASATWLRIVQYVPIPFIFIPATLVAYLGIRRTHAGADVSDEVHPTGYGIALFSCHYDFGTPSAGAPGNAIQLHASGDVERDRQEAERRGFRKIVFMIDFERAQESMREITSLVDRGSVHIPPINELPLEDAIRAHQMIETGHVRGKLVLKVADLGN